MPRLAPAAVGLLVALLCTSVPAQVGVDPAQLQHFEEATSTILCDCGCHPQSVKACACGRAAEMRAEMAAMVERGMSGTEIVEAYVAEKGEQIRIAPKAVGFNLVAWLGPLVGLLLAGIGMFLLLRRMARRGSAEAAEAAETAAPVAALAEDDPYRARLDRALEDLR